MPHTQGATSQHVEGEAALASRVYTRRVHEHVCWSTTHSYQLQSTLLSTVVCTTYRYHV